MTSSHGFSSRNLFGSKEQKISISKGIDLIWGEFNLNTSGDFVFQTSGDACEFSFVLSGSVLNQLSDKVREIAVPCGYVAVWNPPKMEGVHKCRSSENISFVCVSVERTRLREMFAHRLYDGDPIIQGLVEKYSDSILYKLFPMTSAMQVAVRDILLCPYKGDTGKIFLEGKSLELVSHTMGHLFSQNTFANEFLDQGKDSRIRFARQILLENLSSPPSLKDLAERVGLSISTLTRGFRGHYGVSVFEYLRRARLDKAQSLLSDGGMNITEVAYTLGFSSPAHFSRLFLTHFRVTPSEFRRGATK